MTAATQIAVLYLLRHGNDPLWFRAFLESIRCHPAGIDYTPILIHKGFPGHQPHPLASSWTTAGGRKAECVFVSDEGFDLTAYREVAGRIDAGHCLFLNSYARLLGPSWLKTYADAAARLGDHSVVGATGNWGSIDTNVPFPSPHLRTTAIFLKRELFLSFDNPFDTKERCVAFESGEDGLSHRVQRDGGRIALVGRSGRMVAPEDWPEAHIFYAGDQEELLVGDNRSHEYQIAKPRSRFKRSCAAWGRERANIVPRSWLSRRLLHWQWRRGQPVA
ncbi:hypothetical protein [Labrys neptuniae]